MNLRDIIREALAESDSPDPHDVAVLVDARIGSRDVRAVLRALLPDAVREVIREQRNEASAGPVVNGKRGVGEMTSDPHRHQMYVPGFGWKFEADLTADDCDAIADDYEMRAVANAAKAAEWRERARRLRASGGMADAA